MSEDTSLVKATVLPAISVEDAVRYLDEYEKFKSRIVRPHDVMNIQGRQFLKKSFWRKLENFYNLRVECTKDTQAVEDKFGLTFYATYRAIAPNGAYSDGDGACSVTEKGMPKTPHIARAIAHTRAKNRAISDLVGGGEVSAEEMTAEGAIDAEFTEETWEPITDDAISKIRDLHIKLADMLGKDVADAFYKATKLGFKDQEGNPLYTIEKASIQTGREIYRILSGKINANQDIK